MRNKSENWLSYVDRYREDGERCLRCVFSGNREECRRVVCCVIRRSEFVQCETVDFYSMFAAQITMTTEQKHTQRRVCVCLLSSLSLELRNIENAASASRTLILALFLATSAPLIALSVMLKRWLIFFLE